MFNKNIFLVLITIFTYLNFITCTTGENLSVSKKTGDTVTSISSEENDDLKSSTQFVVDKYLALDKKSHEDFIKDFTCDDCNCDYEKYDYPKDTTMIICKGHSNQIDIWKKLFSNDKESSCAYEETREPAHLAGKIRGSAKWIYVYNSWDLVIIGVFYKYFYFYNSDHCKDGGVVKKCGCKILKNATTECMEVCLCKKHFKFLKAWENQIFAIAMRKT